MKPEATFATPGELNLFTVFAAYDFSAAGAGTFTFDPVTRFQIVGLDAIEAKTAHSVSITVTDEVSKRELNLEKRVAFQCNDQDNSSRLISFYNKAKFMANTASLYIQQKGTGDQLYKDYFGSNPDGQVIKNFETVWTDNSPSRTLLCPDTCQSDGPAYVSGDSIFFCKIFFGLSDPLFCPLDVPDPQGAPTTIALITLTHAILQTGSDAVGCHDARNLRNDRKMGNTDNYVVSTQSPRGLPGARPLTWGLDIYSASLLRSSTLTGANSRSVEDYSYLRLFVPTKIHFRVASAIMNCTLQTLCVGYAGYTD